nr:MAG TPA: hypothetical protein [Bacteriophage sp.]
MKFQSVRTIKKRSVTSLIDLCIYVIIEARSRREPA